MGNERFLMDDENRMFMEYAGKLRAMAAGFYRRSYAYNKGRAEYDDIYQALCEAFIKQIRSGTFKPEYLWYDWRLRDAMFNCVWENSFIRMPKNRLVGEMRCLQLESPEKIDTITVNDRSMEEVAEKIDVERFLRGMDDTNRYFLMLLPFLNGLRI